MFVYFKNEFVPKLQIVHASHQITCINFCTQKNAVMEKPMHQVFLILIISKMICSYETKTAMSISVRYIMALRCLDMESICTASELAIGMIGEGCYLQDKMFSNSRRIQIIVVISTRWRPFKEFQELTPRLASFIHPIQREFSF